MPPAPSVPTPPAEPARPTVPGPRTETAPPVPPVPPTLSTPPTAPAAEPAAPQAAAPVPSAAPPSAPAPDVAAPTAPEHEERKEPMNDDQSSAGQPWQSPGDEGWKAAEVVKKPVAAGLTPKGLPKRVPRSNLVPGSADGVGAAKAAAPPIPARSAEAVRSRLASFHQGLRQGRDAAGGDAQPTDPARSTPPASDGPAAFGAPSQEKD